MVKPGLIEVVRLSSTRYVPDVDSITIGSIPAGKIYTFIGVRLEYDGPGSVH